MKRFSRRSFLAATAGFAAAPALGGAAQAGDVDVAIVGAGAAGIAAARRIMAAGGRVAIFEAASQVGGRCLTDTAIFGAPVDIGAHWIHMPDGNPVAKLAFKTGLEVYPAPPGQRFRVGRRNAREGELESFLSGIVKAKRGIEDAARGKSDVSCAQALPKDLGEWLPTIDFYLGAFGCAKDLVDISAVDFARSWERDIDAFCRQGFGTLLTKLADGLPVTLSAPVTRIDTQARGGIVVQSAKGAAAARAVIVTVSTNVLASGKIAFTPDMPKRHLDALNRLKLGSYDRIVLEMPGNPLGLQRDDLVFEKADDTRTAALLANVNGSSLAFIDVAGSFGRDLSSRGTAAMVAFATDWLDKIYGSDIRKTIKRTYATQWNAAPFVLGAFSAASVGGQPSRRILMEPIRDRIYYAGEAAHENMWGTVGGAWESGERAADTIIKLLRIAAPAPVAAAPQKQVPKQRQPRPQPR